MGHRGPDEQNDYHYNSVHLHHLRLSIIDAAGGKQPMHFENKYTVIFNGEIYNHLELRKKFNLNCQTSSDTETLLHLYALKGMSFLDDLDAMFAFILLDKDKNKLFVARDRAGKKPLYYYKDNDKILLASELNCIRGLTPLEINKNSIPLYLRLGSNYKSDTPYKNVKEVEAGSYLIIDINTLQVENFKWWDINKYYLQHNNDSFETALEKVEIFLDKAVQRRVEASDLEVGSFLSGGIDSGLVTAFASKYNKNLRTFTVSFSGQYDEAPLAKLVAQKYNTKHQEISFTFDHLKEDIEKIICNYGEPFADSSAIPSYYVSQVAKKYVTVILNGDGGDELFGGYRRYVPFAKHDFFNKNKAIRTTLGYIKNMLPQSNDKRSFYNYFYRLIDLASKEGYGTYLSSTTDIFEGYENFLEPLGENQFQNDYNKIAQSDMSGLKKLMNLDFDVILFNDLLVKIDIATMAHSLEGRSPLLCKELLEYAPSLNDSYKIKGINTKVLLRKLAEKYLPHELINQPKRGFEIPLVKWIETDLSEIINDTLESKDAYYKNFIDSKFFTHVLENKIMISPEKRAKMMWAAFCLETWYKKCYLV